jgi:hypothetical protein
VSERDRDRERERERERETDRERQRERQTDRETDRQRETETERDRDRDRQRERQTARERHRERETLLGPLPHDRFRQFSILPTQTVNRVRFESTRLHLSPCYHPLLSHLPTTRSPLTVSHVQQVRSESTQLERTSFMHA